MRAPGAAAGLSSGAKVGIAIASVVVVVGAGGIAFAATNGFGMLGGSSSSSEPAPVESDAGSEGAAPSETPEAPPLTGMAAIFADGGSVECHYTVETYFDATATLKSMDVFRVDQPVNGGPSHFIQNEDLTLFWVEGMEEAEKWDTAEFKAADFEPQYRNFDPAEFDAAMADDPDLCVAIPKADDAMFELPAGMGTYPGVPR